MEQTNLQKINFSIFEIQLDLFGRPVEVMLNTGEELSWQELLDLSIQPNNAYIEKDKIIVKREDMSTMIVTNSGLREDDILDLFYISNIIKDKVGVVEEIELVDRETREIITLYEYEIRKILLGTPEFKAILSDNNLRFNTFTQLIMDQTPMGKNELEWTMLNNQKYRDWEKNYLAKARILGQLQFDSRNYKRLSTSLETLKLPPIRLVALHIDCSQTTKLILPDNTVKFALSMKGLRRIKEIDFGKACSNTDNFKFTEYMMEKLNKITARNPIDITGLVKHTGLNSVSLHIMQFEESARLYYNNKDLSEITFTWY